jgi:hypothetical protein
MGLARKGDQVLSPLARSFSQLRQLGLPLVRLLSKRYGPGLRLQLTSVLPCVAVHMSMDLHTQNIIRRINKKAVSLPHRHVSDKPSRVVHIKCCVLQHGDGGYETAR